MEVVYKTRNSVIMKSQSGKIIRRNSTFLKSLMEEKKQ